jgi:hypothetical protein
MCIYECFSAGTLCSSQQNFFMSVYGDIEINYCVSYRISVLVSYSLLAEKHKVVQL